VKRFKDLLFVFNDSIEANAAFERAAGLARRNDARISVVHCVEGMPEDHASDPHLAETWALMRHEWQSKLNLLVEPLRRDGVPAETAILGGISFLEIIRRVQRQGHDLVIKAAQSVGGTRELLFGSTDMHLMRKCPCPVWIQKPQEVSKTSSRILAAVDVTAEDESGHSVNRLIMDLATSLSAIEGSELHVVHAWSFYGESTLRGRAFIRMAQEQVEAMVNQERTQRQGALDGLLEPYRGAGFALKEHLVKGDARIMIPQLAELCNIDLIVMGTLGCTGVSGLLMGNTAEDILRQVNCSVLTVKPEGFVTPVTTPA
jgi:universal stress protein E